LASKGEHHYLVVTRSLKIDPFLKPSDDSSNLTEDEEAVSDEEIADDDDVRVHILTELYVPRTVSY